MRMALTWTSKMPRGARWVIRGLLVWMLIGSTACVAPFRNEDPVAAYDRTRQRLAEERSYAVQRSNFEDELAVPVGERTQLSDFSPARLTERVKQAAGYGPKPEEAKQRFAEAKSVFQQAAESGGPDQPQRFAEAGRRFEAAAKLWPDSELQQDALFMAGEAYFFADKYPKANDRFEELLEKFPNSKYLDRVEAKRFSIAQHWLQLDRHRRMPFYQFNFFDRTRPLRDQRGHALRIFDKIRFEDPTGRLADDSTMALGNAHFERQQFLKADDYYTDLRKTFPNSDHQFNAHFLGVKAKLMSYRGPDYSGQPLDDAEKLIESMRRRFPQQFEEHRDYLNRAYAEVRFRQAERLWTRIRYHKWRNEYGAARYYSRRLLADYADTPLAERAEQVIADSRGKPDEPPQRLRWLVALFPEEEPVRPIMQNDASTIRR